ncbi:MAG: hypothetical protein E6G94_00285 [Alphaproteobacteria bacterium]|nr:MAG: hypothetical protein E6G94_00285 [Alphaproteobacteria bacterium]
MATPYTRARPRSEATLRAEALLGRYPNLSEQELAELINLFPTLSILDRALMTADSSLSGKLDAFDGDHGRKLKAPLSSLLVFLAVPVTFALVTFLFLLG